MTRKLITAVLVVAAFGCARSASTPATPVPRAPEKRVGVHHTQRELRPANVSRELKLDSHRDEGVALHGPEKTYLEQVDNSGWSGRSPGPVEQPPTAIGGGPAADDPWASEDEQSEEK
jgi:hypothetical protein